MGACIQYAHEANADGFAYTEEGNCRLCRPEHLRALQVYTGWKVYKKFLEED